MKNKVFVNDEIHDAENAKISVFDRGYLFSDGIYELIPYFNSKPFLFDEHYNRLEKSLEMIDLVNPYGKDDWMDKIENLIKYCDFKNFSLYIQITRGTPINYNDNILREHAVTRGYKPTVCMFFSEINSLPKELTEKKNAITMEDKRWMQCDIKSISLLFNAYAKTVAHSQGAYEAILIRNGIVTEGCSSNVFIIKNKIIKTTPESKHILPGITRSYVIEELIKNNGYEVTVADFSENDLVNADEVFVTNSTQGIVPITCIDGNDISSGLCGEITERLYKKFVRSL